MLKTRIIRNAFIASIVLAALPAHALDLGGLLNNDHMDNLGKSLLQSAPGNTSSSSAAGLAGISTKDQIGALRQALTQGAKTAVMNLAKVNGYLGNPQVRIPLPGNLQKLDDTLHQVGLGKYGDDLTTAINRAAEAAVPEARNLLVGAVKNMSVADAKGILTGGNDAATQYFRKATETGIAAKFRPIVAKSMKKVKLADKYDQFAGNGAKLGLVDQKDANMEDYITNKAMDGLFLMMAEQEKAIRANPLEATGNLAKKVFSALK